MESLLCVYRLFDNSLHQNSLLVYSPNTGWFDRGIFYSDILVTQVVLTHQYLARHENATLKEKSPQLQDKHDNNKTNNRYCLHICRCAYRRSRLLRQPLRSPLVIISSPIMACMYQHTQSTPPYTLYHSVEVY